MIVRHLCRGVLVTLALLLLSACGGLGGEPRIVATLPPATPAPTEIGHPVDAPDLAVGAQLYAQHCTRCHGENGHGDGELIGTGQNQIPQAPPDFTDPATTAAQTPLDWFTTITDGRIDKLMPPWHDTLTEAERWDVAMYTFMMHVQPDSLQHGESLLEGEGITAADLPSQADLIRITDANLLEAVGLSSAFLDGLDVTENQEVAAYLRSLSLQNVDVIGQSTSPVPASTPEVGLTDAVMGAVSGKVSNGTAGSSLPADLKATLHIFDQQLNDTTQETTVSVDGAFTFANISMQADHSYVVTVEYQGRTFPSGFLAGDPATGKLDLPVTIYEVTSDASVIRIVGWVSQISAVDGALQVTQVVSYTNDSDKVFSADLLPNDDRYAAVQLTLPEGAQVLSVAPDDPRYVVAPDGRTVVDTAPVLPAEQHLAHVVYSLPYSGNLSVEQPLSYAVDGPVRLLITPQAVRITSNQLPYLGPQALSGINYQAYGSDLNLPAGSTLLFTAQGMISGSSDSGSTNVLPLVLIAVGVVAIGLAIYISLKGRNAPIAQSAGDVGALMDGLIREIAELDQQHTDGKVDETTYQNRRAKLKARLAELMDEE